MHMLASLHAKYGVQISASRLAARIANCNCCRTETAEFSKDDLYVARYHPIQTLLKEGWVHLI